MGRRVPVELRIFLTAAAIVDDIGAIIVVAIFYSDALQVHRVAGAPGGGALLVLLNRAGVYRVDPLRLAGVLLWVACIPADCTPRSRACCWPRSSRHANRRTIAHWYCRPRPSSRPRPAMAVNNSAMVHPRPPCVSSIKFMTVSNRRPTPAAAQCRTAL